MTRHSNNETFAPFYFHLLDWNRIGTFGRKTGRKCHFRSAQTTKTALIIGPALHRDRSRIIINRESCLKISAKSVIVAIRTAVKGLIELCPAGARAVYVSARIELRLQCRYVKLIKMESVRGLDHSNENCYRLRKKVKSED